MTMDSSWTARQVPIQPAQMTARSPVLDRVNQTIRKGRDCTQLSPKAYAVLDYLRVRPKTLVSKDEILDAVWSNVCVGDAVLKNAVCEVRRALGDDPSSPQFIGTVCRRGYRFVGDLPLAETSTSPVCLTPDEPKLGPEFPAARRHEWQQLNEYWQRAYAGQRQLVFVNGEPGVGKTSLVNAWQEQVSASANVLCARGHCQQRSVAEGEYFYLPILDALGRLCRVPAAERVIALLAWYAPNWLRQLSWLHGHPEPVLETSANPSLLELVAFIEALSKETPLVLVFEDLHWSDSATLDLLAFLARRDEPAQLAIVCTLQSCGESSGGTLHRFRQELLLHDCCQEITLDFFSLSNLADYLSQRCPGVEFGQDFCAALHCLTEGYPLLVDRILDTLPAQNRRQSQTSLWEVSTFTHGIGSDLPTALQRALSVQREQLGALERRVLEAASVFAPSFSAMELARLLDRQELEIEEICENLVAYSLWLQRLDGDGRTGAGGFAQSYCFRRALYRRDIFASLQPAQKQRLQKHLVQDSNSRADYDAGIASILRNHANPPVERLAYSTLG